jgi:hypothetical protein
MRNEKVVQYDYERERARYQKSRTMSTTRWLVLPRREHDVNESKKKRVISVRADRLG